MLKIFAATLFFGPLLALAQCPNWMQSKSANLPLCPDGKNPTLVPETFPVGAIVVSDRGYIKGNTTTDSNFTVSVVEKVLKGAGENTPMIILPVRSSTVDKIKAHIDGMQVSQKQKDQWKAALIHVPATGYTWQQDYMQAFVNPQSGKVVLRNVVQDTRPGDSFKQIISATKSCDFIEGQPLTHPVTQTPAGDEIASGTLGGNIETLPGGLCLLGDDNFGDEGGYKEYAKSVCGSVEDLVKVPTWWLTVGHTDEIIKVVRNKKQAAPCDFSIVVASPQKGLELLRKNPKKKFIDFPAPSSESMKRLESRQYDKTLGLRKLCYKHENLQNRRKDSAPNHPQNPSRGVSKIFEIRKFVIFDAYAGSYIENEGANASLESCAKLSNEDIYRIFSEDNELKNYNQLVQKQMDNLKTDVGSKLKNKFPQCHVDFIEAPGLFYGGYVIEGINGQELPKNMGLSLLPNPTNSISINDTLISPAPINAAFRSYLEDQYQKRGLKPEFVDTFEYAHRGRGNLHCSTNTIHVCRPRGRQ